MTLRNCYGIISEIRPVVKGYTRLTIATNIPFKTRYLKFNVWESRLLKKPTMEPFKIGEEVQVDYHVKNNYPQLDSMISAAIDNCPVCYSSLEAINAQRIECLGCSTIPEAEHSRRVNTQMKLVSYSLKEYQNSKGYRLELYSAAEDKTFTPVIFENNLLFSGISNLKVGEAYFVVGWEGANGYFFDVDDIY